MAVSHEPPIGRSRLWRRAVSKLILDDLEDVLPKTFVAVVIAHVWHLVGYATEARGASFTEGGYEPNAEALRKLPPYFHFRPSANSQYSHPSAAGGGDFRMRHFFAATMWSSTQASDPS